MLPGLGTSYWLIYHTARRLGSRADSLAGPLGILLSVVHHRRPCVATLAAFLTLHSQYLAACPAAQFVLHAAHVIIRTVAIKCPVRATVTASRYHDDLIFSALRAKNRVECLEGEKGNAPVRLVVSRARSVATQTHTSAARMERRNAAAPARPIPIQWTSVASQKRYASSLASAALPLRSARIKLAAPRRRRARRSTAVAVRAWRFAEACPAATTAVKRGNAAVAMANVLTWAQI